MKNIILAFLSICLLVGCKTTDSNSLVVKKNRGGKYIVQNTAKDESFHISDYQKEYPMKEMETLDDLRKKSWRGVDQKRRPLNFIQKKRR